MDINNFWKDAPDIILEVEPTWDGFIESLDGVRISNELNKSPSFNNADYLLPKEEVVIELKEIVTEFSKQPSFDIKFDALMHKLIKKEPDWKPFLLGGDGSFPKWFHIEFIKIFRPPLTRILKKANKQIRETKEYYNLKNNRGVVVIVNDGFNSLEPQFIISVISDILVNSYSSIDCMIYVTLNRYISFQISDTPSLIWSPLYSKKGEVFLHPFINDLGRKWFKYINKDINFTVEKIETDHPDVLLGAKAILLPHEKS